MNRKNGLLMACVGLLALLFSSASPTRSQTETTSTTETVFDSALVAQAASVLPDTTIAFVVVDLRALKNGDFSTLGNLFGLDRLLGITFMNSGSTQPTPGIEDLIVEALYTTLTSVYTYQRDGEIVTLDSVSDWLGDYAVIALNELPEAPERNYAAIDAGLIMPVPSATPSLNTPDPLYSVWARENLVL